jgi:hypothetical protein
MKFSHFAASLLVIAAASAQAADAWLGPAPRIDPDAPPPAQQPQGFFPKAVSPVGTINTMDRAAVVNAYNTYYNVSMPAVGFTGSVAGCNPGSISLAFQEWTVTRINFLRAMAGVPGNTTLDTSLNGQQQAAALIMAANSTLTHAPSAGMTCYSQAGYNGASSSNIALGTGLTDAIPLYMTDPGAGNEVVGHRRWILHSAKTRFGLGNANGAAYNGNALYTFDNINQSIPVPSGIPWPPRGYVPLALFPAPFGAEGQRWSFGLPGANFGAANVSLTLNGTNVPVTVISRTDNGFGDNTIVWQLPSGHAVVKDTAYTVNITGVSGAASSSYSYQVLPINPADPIVSPPRLANISTRMQVLTGDDVMIGGFVIGGSTPKTVVVRARGPSLAAQGVAGVLGNPFLQVFSGANQIAANDNFGSLPNLVQLQASGFAPAHALESAVMMTLNPGAYTAIVTGVSNTTGVAIVEVFEVDAITTPLINISTRGRVQTGDNVMIGGFIIQGTSPQTVVVRARGPSLAAQGVPGTLSNPTLQLFSGAAVIASNDDWGTASNAAQIQSSGFAPSDSRESAIRMTLNPGAYTAIVSGAGNATGVAIIEVFAQ